MEILELAATVMVLTALLFVAAAVLRGRPWPLWTGPILGVVLMLVELGILHPIGTMSTYDPEDLVWVLNWRYPVSMLVAGSLPIVLIRIAWAVLPGEVLDRLRLRPRGEAGGTGDSAD